MSAVGFPLHSFFGLLSFLHFHIHPFCSDHVTSRPWCHLSLLKSISRWFLFTFFLRNPPIHRMKLLHIFIIFYFWEQNLNRLYVVLHLWWRYRPVWWQLYAEFLSLTAAPCSSVCVMLKSWEDITSCLWRGTSDSQERLLVRTASWSRPPGASWTPESGAHHSDQVSCSSLCV